MITKYKNSLTPLLSSQHIFSETRESCLLMTRRCGLCPAARRWGNMTLVLGTAVNMHNITQYSTVQYSTQYSSKYAQHWSELFTFLLNTPLCTESSKKNPTLK